MSISIFLDFPRRWRPFSRPKALTEEGRTPQTTNPTDNVVASLALWYSRYSQRRALRELDRHLMADIGVDIEAVRREINKKFWQP